MVEIVNDSYDCAGKPEVTDAERIRIAATWARQLNGYIPGERLKETFDYVFDRKTDSFLIGPVDLKLAFAEILAHEESERLRREKEIEDRRRAADRTQFCRNKENHLPDFKEALIEVSHNGTDFFKSPCPDCRPKAHEQWALDRARQMKLDAPKALQIMLVGAVGSIAKTEMIKNAVRRTPNPHYKPMLLCGVQCSQCGEEIRGQYIQLSPDFILCRSCDESARNVDRDAVANNYRDAA